MFYVSNISGALVPFEPGITPLSVTVSKVSSIPPISEGVVSPVESAFPGIIEPLLSETTTQTVSVFPKGQDAALYEGSTILTGPGAQALTDIANIAKAGAIAAYQTRESARANNVQTSGALVGISVISEADRIDDSSEQSDQIAKPVKDYRRNSDERKRAVVAADIMSSPVFTLTDSSPNEVAKKVFRDHKFRHIPIVSNNGRLVGILSDRDFIGISSEETPGLVRELMVTNILTAHPQTEIPKIAEAMITHRIGCLPITDETGTLVGILTRTDILHAIVNHAPIELWT